MTKGDEKIKSRFKCSQGNENSTTCADDRNPIGICLYDYCPRKTGKPPTIKEEQSPQGHAPLSEGDSVAKAETCSTCIKKGTEDCQYKDEGREVEGCSFHKSEQPNL